MFTYKHCFVHDVFVKTPDLRPSDLQSVAAAENRAGHLLIKPNNNHSALAFTRRLELDKEICMTLHVRKAVGFVNN